MQCLEEDSCEKDIVRMINLGHNIKLMLCGREEWTCTEKEYSKLKVFQTKWLRAIIGKNRDE